ncbi:polyprenol phosphomannose-dependent alpha 1,6 mannosyltransferase MptB [Symbioplanes lichenis]|uniref:polyprenol phosphomannose-dependent alpha 1,6 mannosyltransferase MptB n=1 Tax=Symbioplanes lichenis TaxID=1629072 RepID=UPI0027396CAD|nr:polyprenol phosphomannose-dependent alpha 1,6 mannosyltransferase MptB [Actinoplanes lichenis]
MSPRLIRWGGFAGSLATAGTAWLGGAGYERLPSVNPGTLLSGQRGVLLPILWVTGITVLILAWWYGRHAVPSTRWALLTAGLWYLPLLPVLPLGSADVYSYACQGWVQHVGGDPYAGGVGGSGCPWLTSVDPAWTASPAPYGPLFLLAAGVTAAAGTLAGVIAGLRIVALLGLALLAVGVPVLARRMSLDPARALWIVLACPLVLIHFVSGAHNDALMAGLIVGGLALAASRPAWPWLIAAGAVLGLAVGVKATAIVVVPFAVILGTRPLWRSIASVGGGVLLATAALTLLSGRGIGWVGGLLRSGDTVAWTSPSTAVGIVLSTFFGKNAIEVTRLLGVLLLAVILVALWFRALRHGDPIRHAGLALAATVLCAPVFHPWYAVWPLAVLLRGRLLLALCAFAATLTTPAGYNWALYTRVPGAILVTALLVVAAIRVRRDRRVAA